MGFYPFPNCLARQSHLHVATVIKRLNDLHQRRLRHARSQQLTCVDITGRWTLGSTAGLGALARWHGEGRQDDTQRMQMVTLENHEYIYIYIYTYPSACVQANRLSLSITKLSIATHCPPQHITTSSHVHCHPLCHIGLHPLSLSSPIVIHCHRTLSSIVIHCHPSEPFMTARITIALEIIGHSHSLLRHTLACFCQPR